MLTLYLLILLHLLVLGGAHPGDHDESAYFRSLTSIHSIRDTRQKLVLNSDHPKRSGIDARAATRRMAILSSHLDASQSSSIPKSPRSYSPQAAFSSSENPSCLLTPEATVGLSGLTTSSSEQISQTENLAFL